jgi:predicted Rossmann fold nucleotide-binding protein DprA/Smf involved in DNA uptake
MNDIQHLINEASQRIQAIVKQQADLIEMLRKQQEQQLSLFPVLQTPPQTKRTVRINVEAKPQTESTSGRKPDPNSKTGRILALIGQGHTTSRALAQQTGLSVSNIAAHLCGMRSQGLIRKVGTEPNPKTITRVVTLPAKPYLVYNLTDKGQNRLQTFSKETQQPAATVLAPRTETPAPQPTKSYEPQVKDRTKLTPRDEALLSKIRMGFRSATELSKQANVAFETTTQSMYLLQRLGYITIQNIYKVRPNVDNRMARHLVDRIAKPT